MFTKFVRGFLIIILGIGLFLQPGAGAPGAQASAPLRPQWLQHYSPFVGSVASANYGAAVAQSQDGSILVSGARDETVGANAGQGAAHVYRISAGSWTEYPLHASDGAANDHFGVSVAVSADGSTILVGAYQADISANTNQGAVYVFIWSGSAWTQQAKLTAASGSASEFIGSAVALSSDGSTALVGAVGFTYTQFQQGAAFVFTRTGTSWSQQTINPLFAFDAAASDFMGSAVALSGDGSTALVSATGKNSNQGAAYVYTRSGASWSFQHKFIAWDGAVGDDFARSVALSSDGSTALIGADNAKVNGHSLQGAAYTFKRAGSVWSNGVKLTAADGAAGDWFGYSVSLSPEGSVAVIGAPMTIVNTYIYVGAAYVFYSTNFVEQEKLVSNNADATDHLGWAVSASNLGSNLLVGAPNLTWGTTHQGGIYQFQSFAAHWWQQDAWHNTVGSTNEYYGSSLALSSDGNTALVGTYAKNMIFFYARANQVWSAQSVIPIFDSNVTDFGSAVALSGDGNTALVGASQTMVNGKTGQGAAYLLTRSGVIWSAPVQITASDGLQGNNFGAAVALSADGSTAAIGARGTNANQGAVYVMTRTGQTWSPLTRIVAADGNPADLFGDFLALNSDGSTLLVGADNASNGTIRTGAAYAFVRAAGVYTQQKKFMPASGYDTSHFGRSVALSSDGNTALIGEPYMGGGQISGQALYYTRSGSTWSGSTFLTAEDNFGIDHFGLSVALSTDGNTAVIGAPQVMVDGAVSQGAAYVFKRTGSVFNLVNKLIIWDNPPSTANAEFTAISGDGHTILLGSSERDTRSGAAYVFIDNVNFQVFLPQVRR